MQEADSTDAAPHAAGTIAALQTLRDQLSGDPLAQNALLSTIQEMERLLRSGEAIATRYRSLINAVPDAVTVHDEDGNILEANDAACAIYGYPLAQLRTMSVYDLNPNLPPEHMREVMRTFEFGRTVTVETTNRRGDGSTFPVEVHSNLFLDGRGRRIVAVARDITHRRAADAELRASEARYRALLQAMDKGVLVQDREGHILSVNPAGCRILGLSESELIEVRRASLEAWRFEDDAGRPVAFDAMPAMRALRTRVAVETTLIGVYLPHLHSYRWLSIGAVPQFREGEEEPFQVISTFGDVSDFRRDGALFAKTQALANIGGWEFDFATRVLYWTDEMYRIHDLPAGTPLTEERALGFYVAADRARLERVSEEARVFGRSFELDLRLASASGRRRWVRVMGQPLRRHGQIYGLSGTTQDITERKLHEEQLRRQAQTDTLTGLANRDTGMANIEAALVNAAPGRGPALLYVDLDRFKIVNDMLGHAAGDRLLAAAAERLARSAGDHVSGARFGGDEFLLLVGAGDDPQLVAERVTAAFAQPFSYAGEEFALTVSIGIAAYPQDGATAQQLVTHADAAMVEAKRRGRNTWQGFNPQLARNLNDRLLIESQLRRALDNQEFRLEFLPTIDLAGGQVIGAEALLRWNNRQLGEMPPGAFIGHAENSGDIVRIGAWVIREACRQIRRWIDDGVGVPRLSVNVSYRQFLSENLPEVVAAALREFALPGDALDLEMTERVLIDDVPDTLDTFATLRKLGVSLTIDDFGEGFSGLNYLRRLPIDGLKISHGFMQGIPANATDTAVCEAILRIAHSLGLVVTAEGVETEAQHAFLMQQRAPRAQGFLFSRPLPAARFVEFCAAWKRHAPLPEAAHG